MNEFTMDDLRKIMRESAGEDGSGTLDGDILDNSFEELGYDSLALMETTSRIERALSVTLPEEDMADVSTPRDLLAFVNGQLTELV
ncbi:MAG TPA: acyl carrier protein [Pseudonocardiaceae bacterium]|nr:acyl carrier protein [Pseudonocardiaceae bacterium]